MCLRFLALEERCGQVRPQVLHWCVLLFTWALFILLIVKVRKGLAAGAAGSASAPVLNNVQRSVTPRSSTGGSGTPVDPRSPSTDGPWQWADTLAMLAGMTFTSSWARKVANASALGFLGFLAALAFIPLPSMRWCLGFSGFFGFFGLTGVAFIIEYAARHKAKRRAAANGDLSAGASGADIEQARNQVQGPAIGLLVTGIVNWVLSVPLFLIILWLAGSYTATPVADHGSVVTVNAPQPAMIVAPILGILVTSALMIFAALKMKRLQAYWMAVIASSLAIIVSPSNLIGLPIGIWALVVLSQREVRAAFTLSSQVKPNAAARPIRRQNVALGTAALVVACISPPCGVIVVPPDPFSSILFILVTEGVAFILGSLAWRSGADENGHRCCCHFYAR